MGLFFSRKPKSELSDKLNNMKCREVNFVSVDIDEFLTNFEADRKAILALKPVNYYALKTDYIKASCYSDAEANENYIFFTCMADSVKNEHATYKSKVYDIDRITFVKMMAKFGIML